MENSGNPQGRLIYTPSQLNREARIQLEGMFGNIWIEGEVSNLKVAASGHAYFTLKDAQAQVSCALFRHHRMRSAVQLADGLQILLRGKVSLYEPRGNYQIIADYVEEAGLGRLRKEFEALKARLKSEGLFESERKRALPRYPRHVAVVSSAQGAAIRDVISVLERRYPCVRVSLFQSAVQGAEAPSQLRSALASAIRAAPDLILITRGGGSIEDLWGFNDEALARDIAASPIPTVSAVGHEVDFTIADFVADVRAPTPSAAAEIIVPDQSELLIRLDRQLGGLQQAMLRRLDMAVATVTHLERRLGSLHPGKRLLDSSDRMMRSRLRLSALAAQALERRQQQLQGLAARLRQASPARELQQYGIVVQQLRQRLERVSGLALENRRQAFANVTRALNAVSPLEVLKRGYAVVNSDDGRLLTRADSVQPGDRIRVRLDKGSIDSEVIAVFDDPGSE